MHVREDPGSRSMRSIRLCSSCQLSKRIWSACSALEVHSRVLGAAGTSGFKNTTFAFGSYGESSCNRLKWFSRSCVVEPFELGRGGGAEVPDRKTSPYVSKVTHFGVEGDTVPSERS